MQDGGLFVGVDDGEERWISWTLERRACDKLTRCGRELFPRARSRTASKSREILERTGGLSNPQRTDACQDTRARNRAVRLARHLNAIGISPT